MDPPRAAAIVAVDTDVRGLAQRLDRQPGSGDEVPAPYRVEAVVAARDEAHVRTLRGCSRPPWWRERAPASAVRVRAVPGGASA
ncbi:hypothetical protein [Streptomyces sp. YU58]|uniref:hypothetical protein n=1 Tax=Streptomyces sp. SX92 TaxID=3158972 RepID=UPI0027BA4FF3|nr:hypothetical protein [Streptomyces coralus]WLW51265.1 hypothetical protein QU709_07815 [Streptomyces coralus]